MTLYNKNVVVTTHFFTACLEGSSPKKSSIKSSVILVYFRVCVNMLNSKFKDGHIDHF